MAAEYYVKRKDGPHFEVAKFHDSEQPLEVYEVDYSSAMKIGRCTCMAYRSGKTRPCKHLVIVKAFLSQGEPEAQAYPDPKVKA